METIIAAYSVCDCEHHGDIRRAECEVREQGGRVITSEWDGEDCGEAYVYCEISKKKFDEELKHQEWSWYNAENMRPYFKSRGWVK